MDRSKSWLIPESTVTARCPECISGSRKPRSKSITRGYPGLGSGLNGYQTAQMLMCIEQVLLPKKADWVLVCGTLAPAWPGTMAAAKLHDPGPRGLGRPAQLCPGRMRPGTDSWGGDCGSVWGGIRLAVWRKRSSGEGGEIIEGLGQWIGNHWLFPC